MNSQLLDFVMKFAGNISWKAIRIFNTLIYPHSTISSNVCVGAEGIWSSKIDAKIVAEEEPFLQLVFKIGLLGCVCYFIMTLISFSLHSWVRYILASGGSFDWLQYYIILRITNDVSFIIAILMAIGFFALLRSNLSRLALPYVFLSLISYATSWFFLLSLGFI